MVRPDDRLVIGLKDREPKYCLIIILQNYKPDYNILLNIKSL